MVNGLQQKIKLDLSRLLPDYLEFQFYGAGACGYRSVDRGLQYLLVAKIAGCDEYGVKFIAMDLRQ